MFFLHQMLSRNNMNPISIQRLQIYVEEEEC
jgi:hypothetical protein